VQPLHLGLHLAAQALSSARTVRRAKTPGSNTSARASAALLLAA
jgi:hypothetical protein